LFETMRALLASAALLVLAVALYGDAARSLFTPAQPATYSYVPEPAAPQGMIYQQQALQYGQPVAYADPRVQIVTVSQRTFGWSDLALLAVASGIAGVVIGKASAEQKTAARPIVEDIVDEAEEMELATIAALAVGGESKGDLETLAKNLNPAIGFYDPLALSEGEFWGQSNEATIGFLRHAEIKHGRVAMAGFVGYCVHANGIHFPWKIPGDELCAPGVSPTALWQGIPYEAKLQIILAIGIFEFYSEAAMSAGEGVGGHYMRGGKPGLFPAFKGPVKGTLADKDGNPLLPHPVP
jgi:hypothetical protein